MQHTTKETMRAAVYHRYGGPEVVSLAEIARPRPASGEILVKVAAAGVTTADWRMRAAAFPGLVAGLAGRAMFGLFRPRNPVLGSAFAGTVAGTGPDVRDFTPGQRVIGFAPGGAHADYLRIDATGAVIPIPDTLSDAEAAALPFGALSALDFLDRLAGLRAGERVLVLGASGGVGAYAVQIARALGAEVTGVASAAREALVRDLGATEFVDYRRTDLARIEGTFDVILDTIGVIAYRQAAPMLTKGGRFVPLNFGMRDLLATRAARRAGHRVILSVSKDTREGLIRLAEMIRAGTLRPVLDSTFPLAAIREAHARVETRHAAGAVVVTMG
jgi:NADPH:quinone reductase-like Zn-dependent oxidoreductase